MEETGKRGGRACMNSVMQNAEVRGEARVQATRISEGGVDGLPS